MLRRDLRVRNANLITDQAARRRRRNEPRDGTRRGAGVILQSLALGILTPSSRLRLPAHSAAGSTASATGAGFGGGRGRRGSSDSEDREQLIDVRARTLLAGDVGCGGPDYSLELCSTLTALVFEYRHRSISVIRTAPGYSLFDYSGGESRFSTWCIAQSKMLPQSNILRLRGWGRGER